MATILDVSALNRYVQSIFQDDVNLQDIAIRGEISNFNRHHKTGHCYFTLSDKKASIKAVLFRTQADRLSFYPKNGMNVVARGRVSLYEKEGAYQIYVDALFEDGTGAQKMTLDALKEKLRQEGLFEEAHKKQIPYFAWNVGVITSKSGAALQDILNVAQRRNPCAKIVLFPVSVQGNGAASKITQALYKMDAIGLDVIIIARGGGSSEDLSAFQDEALVRAVFQSNTPIISAIGHEVDFTLLDFVADKRAPTPSVAAELAFVNIFSFLQKQEDECKNQGKNIHNYLNLCYNKMRIYRQELALQAPSKQLERQQAKLNHISLEVQQKTHNLLVKYELSFRECTQLAAGLSPYAVLARGYTIVRKEEKTIDSVLKLKDSDTIDIAFQDGSVQATVQKISHQQEILSYE